MAATPQLLIGSVFYRSTYRFGTPRWDTGRPRPELAELVQSRPPGRALDLGCGTGTDSVYLAGHGWQVVGVDFAPRALQVARRRARDAGVAAEFVTADVTRLGESGIEGPFDLVTDVGCYHGLPSGRRDAYVAGLAGVTRKGADVYLAGISGPPASWRLIGAVGVDDADISQRFGGSFQLAGQSAAGTVGRRSRFTLYHLVRR